MQAKGKILYKEDKERLFIRITGELRHTMSGGFEALLKKYLNEKNFLTYVQGLVTMHFMLFTTIQTLK